MASETTFTIREVRAYSTKQRPNPVTVHGPYPTREAAMEALRIKASNASRNDNRSSWYVEADALSRALPQEQKD